MGFLDSDKTVKIGKLTLTRKQIVNICVIIVALIAIIVFAAAINNHGSVKCPECLGDGTVLTNSPTCETCEGEGKIATIKDGTPVIVDCPDCEGEGVIEVDEAVRCTCSECEGEGVIETENRYYGTFVSLLPPIIAIVLALITKEVYISLFVGVLSGALFNGGFSFAASMDAMVSDGFIGVLSDVWNMGIVVFLVILGTMVAMINSAGGAEAFGRWAKKRIKTKTGAALATFFLGILIFIDDYFNCLTVGSVMRPVTDKKKISREKLAYLIDATAAPICMIAPISSWAAAVSSTAKQVGTNGISLFVNAIPYNFYSLLTIVMIIALILLRVDFGPMKKYEQAAEMMDDINPEAEEAEESVEKGGSRVIDLVIPVVLLIVSCVFGMLYSGGFFNGDDDVRWNVINAFGNSDASVGLPWGSLIALVITGIYFIARKRLTFKQTMETIPKGFIAMVPAIMILTFAWSLNAMTSGLGAAGFVGNLMKGSAAGLMNMLPAIIFLVALGLAFATGTSWGTFGILIPIVVAVFGHSGELLVIGISACLAGAVCGDHCSPISDTTIMASAGADCNHVNHVSTQLPYALTAAAVSFISFILAGFIQMWYVVLPIAIIMMVGVIVGIKYLQKYLDSKKGQAAEAVVAGEAESEKATSDEE